MSTNSHDSGKAQKKRKIKQKPVLEQLPTQQQASEDGNSKFARCLGSTDYASRDKGVQALANFLLYKDELPELDVMKLWKGLFFCFWHSDKVPVQTELAERLAGLLPQMKPRMAQLYWAGLLATLRREWFAMDHHRIDKFLMLVRKFVAALFVRIKAAHWDPATITSVTLQLPLGQDLLPPSASKSLGLSYHIADVWLQELQKLAAAEDQPVPHGSLLQLLEPFVRVLEASGEQALITRVKEAVFDVLVADTEAATAATPGDDGSDDDSSAHLIYCQQLDVEQLAALLFERGAAEGVKSRNRQLLYNISKELEKAASKGKKRTAAGRDGEQLQQQKQKQHKRQKIDQQEHQQEHQQEQGVNEEQGGGQQQQQQEDTAMDLQQQPQRHDHQREPPATLRQKKKKKHQQVQAVQVQDSQAEQQGPEPVVANGKSPSSNKRAARLQQQQQQQLDTVVAGDSPAVAAAVAAAAATPQAATDSVQKSSKKKRKHSTEQAPPNDSSAAKRGVVINLRKNVYFKHGAPVPPEDIRTPPTAKPKGSALKARSSISSASAPAKQLSSRLDAVATNANGKRKPVTPGSVPRVKAAAFF